MICDVCKYAADAPYMKGIPEGDKQRIQALHAMCVFPKSCCCQHREGVNVVEGRNKG